MTMNFIARLLFAGVILTSISLTAQAFEVRGKSLFDEKEIRVGTDAKKGVVVVFLSAICPCSQSHTEEIAKLSQDFPEFHFVGVHSNADEGKDVALPYFNKSKLPFPIIQDRDAKIANEFKALKTPHAFVVLNDGSTVYQGGVSSSRDFSHADQKYLREALSDLKAGRKVKISEGRTLGCIISRG